ncbi:hypothetical protein [Oryzihumus leptocrescens]|uniref:Excreted virulence factor EspC (Type VII ESX diderm) n=1 Tax=Oryzihumus leptocrescens TaxID=297536 RepID=A0A542ZGY1_9MICO|nr:hypothetical protein [Oryzihumus leptocrescens]TQL59571.1 hypothetical protein FB474_0927 [Oryzihumus leptocrescens]
MSDLSYAVDELNGLGSKLHTLSHDLKSVDGHADLSVGALAHARVVGAMDHFRTNWDDNRDHLAEKLGQLGDLAAKAAEGFSQADADLARKIRDAVKGA